MPNDHFSFKQFTVFQDKCAMKVCTDACIQGAWTAINIPSGIKNILDIGTGTGLLSLMLAQKTSATIDAIEIDNDAFEQAGSNLQLSKWAERLNVHHISLQEFDTDNKYDCIICNPPFYSNNLHSPDNARNAAMHGTTLTLKFLVEKIMTLLSEKGIASVMIPYHRIQEFENLLVQFNLYKKKVLRVKHTGEHDFFRCIFIFTKEKQEVKEEELIIKDLNGYTITFVQLLKDYYLKL